MPWIIGGVIAGGSVLSGLLGSNASGKAADAQRQASAEATAETRRQYDLTRADRMPWLDQGRAGLYKLSDLLGIDTPRGAAPSRDQYTTQVAGRGSPTYQPAAGLSMIANPSYVPPSTRFDDAGYNAAVSAYDAQQPVRSSDFGSLMQDFTGADLESEPGYQFGLDQGRNTLDQSAASRGTLFSGKTLKDLIQFGQDYGGTKYGEAFNRDAANKNRKYKMLADLSGTGSSSASDLGQAGMGFANTIGNLATGAGNATAAGIIGQSNAWGNAIGSGTNAYFLNRYLNPSTSTGNVKFTPGVGI